MIGFAKADSFRRDRLLERDNLAAVRQAVEAVGGRPLQVEIVTLEDQDHSGDSGEETQTESSTATLDVRKKQRNEHIQAVLDIFSGGLIT